MQAIKVELLYCKIHQNPTMAKKVSNKKKLPDSTRNVVQVNSRTYGRHLRTARGSKTTTTLNNAFAANAEKTAAINTAAKAIYGVLKLYSQGFREGQLWQAMLSRMRTAVKTNFEALLHTLEGLELNRRYALERFINLPEFIVENNKKALIVEMKAGMPPHLNKNDNCYQYELIVLLFNSKGVCIQHALHQTIWMDKKDKINKQVFSFQKPVQTKYYLLCMHLKSGVNGIVTDTFPSRGMAIVQAAQVK